MRAACLHAGRAFVHACKCQLSAALPGPQVRKVPLMREPWEHFIGAGIGAFLGNELVKYTDRTEREIEELLRRREESNKGFRVPSMAGGPTPGASK